MSKPERIWVPRRLLVSDEGELLVGPMTGLLVDVAAIPQGTIPRRRRLRDARHTLWLVERAKLDEALIDDYALVLPERLIDRDVQPHAYRWLAELPLVCVSGLKAERIVREDRLRLYRIAVEDRGTIVFTAEARGGDAMPWAFEADLAALEAAAEAPRDGELGRSLKAIRSVLDRLLRQLSRGVLSEEAVVAAWQAADLVEPGYGYRGGEEAVPATIEEVQFRARALDAVFAQIEPRASLQVEVAEAIAKELASPRGDDDPLPSLPVLGDLIRYWQDEVVLDLEKVAGRFTAGPNVVPEFLLPREPRWFVGPCEPWEPVLPPGLERELRSVLREKAPPPKWVALLAVGLLVIVALVSFALRR